MRRSRTRTTTLSGMGLGGLLFFAVFWCSITGVFVGFVVHSFLGSAKAARYVPVDGKVLASRVVTGSDSDGGTTYRYSIRYAYTVSGKPYEGDRYAFGMSSSSGGRHRAGALAAHYPVGSAITVLVDPLNPDEAVIDRNVDPTMYFLLLFLQPFILIGLGLIVACIAFPFQRAAARRFAEREPALPWAIPGWGTVQRDFNGYVLKPRPTVLSVLVGGVAGYGITCFLAIFVVGIAFGGFGQPRLGAVAGAFIVAIAVGITAAVFSVRSTGRKAQLTINTTTESIDVVSPLRSTRVPLVDVGAWVLKSILNPRNVKQEGASMFVPLLAVRTMRGEVHPIHVFGADDRAPAVASKVAEAFAAWTGKPLEQEAAPAAGSPVDVLSAGNLMAAAREVRQAAAQLRDLM